MSPRARILVVANRTADSPELIAALRRRAARSPAALHPSRSGRSPRPGMGRRHEGGRAGGSAPRRDRRRRMRAAGLDLEATIVGDPDPIAAVGDALRAHRFDEVIVSTLPRGVSRWLRLSLPHRLRRMTDVPVLHVIAHPRRAAARAPDPASWRGRAPELSRRRRRRCGPRRRSHPSHRAAPEAARFDSGDDGHRLGLRDGSGS